MDREAQLKRLEAVDKLDLGSATGAVARWGFRKPLLAPGWPPGRLC